MFEFVAETTIVTTKRSGVGGRMLPRGMRGDETDGRETDHENWNLHFWGWDQMQGWEFDCNRQWRKDPT